MLASKEATIVVPNTTTDKGWALKHQEKVWLQRFNRQHLFSMTAIDKDNTSNNNIWK